MTDIEESIEAVIENYINNLNTCMPAKIERVDMTSMQVDARPLMVKRYINGTILPPPLIRNIPVVMSRNNASIFYMPLNNGDQVMLLFGQRDITEFLGSTDEFDFYFPQSRRKYDINDAIAVPGLYSFNSQISNAPLNKALQNSPDLNIIHFDNVIRLSSEDGVEINTTTTTIKIDKNGLVTIEGDVQINGNVNVSGTVDADEVSANGVDLSTHIHSGVQTGGGTTGGPV